jgi:Protein of unknown function (DUF3037)
MTREPYTYALLRYRHDAVAGEQINIGIAIYAAKRGYLRAEIRKSHARISNVFPDVDSSALKRDLSRIERAFEKIAKLESESLLSGNADVMTFAGKVIGADDGSFVWSNVGSGLSSDPENTLAHLYARFVSQYDKSSIHRRQDAEVWRPFRDRLAERKIAEIFSPKVIQSKHNSVEFEHAWKNGKWHCIQALSFDLVTEEGIQEKAARWVGHMVGLKKAEEKFRPYFLVGQPSDENMRPAFEKAVEFLKESPVEPEIVTEDQFDRFADELAEKVHASQR